MLGALRYTLINTSVQLSRLIISPQICEALSQTSKQSSGEWNLTQRRLLRFDMMISAQAPLGGARRRTPSLQQRFGAPCNSRPARQTHPYTAAARRAPHVCAVVATDTQPAWQQRQEAGAVGHACTPSGPDPSGGAAPAHQVTYLQVCCLRDAPHTLACAAG
jgi:hypothetical protein